MLELTVEVPVLHLDLLGLRLLEWAGHCVGWDLHALIWLLEWGVMQVMLCCRNILERSLCNKKNRTKPKRNTNPTRNKGKFPETPHSNKTVIVAYPGIDLTNKCICVYGALWPITFLWLNTRESFMLQLEVTVVRAWQPNLLIVPVSEHCWVFFWQCRN